MGRIRVQSRWIAFFVTALLAIVVFGCGGGGGSSSGSTSTSSTTSSTGVGVATDVTVYAFFQGTQSPASPYVTQNPLAFDYQLVPGNNAQIQLWGINSVTQQPQQVPASNFTVTSSASVATISGSGLLSAKSASPNVQYTVSASSGGIVYSAGFQVINPTAIASGVVQDNAGNLVQGVTLNFYNAGGTLLAQTISGADGSFIANVPPQATLFSADASALSQPSYYKEYGVGNFYYSTTTQACYTPLPTLTVGVKTALPTVVVIPDTGSNPPPPPTGCGQ